MSHEPEPADPGSDTPREPVTPDDAARCGYCYKPIGTGTYFVVIGTFSALATEETNEDFLYACNPLCAAGEHAMSKRLAKREDAPVDGGDPVDQAKG